MAGIVHGTPDPDRSQIRERVQVVIHAIVRRYREPEPLTAKERSAIDLLGYDGKVDALKAVSDATQQLKLGQGRTTARRSFDAS